MITHILIPTDFSAVANNALSYAIDLAKKTGAQIHVLHVKHVPVMDASFPAETYQIYLDEIDKAAKMGMEELEKNILETSGVKYDLQTVMGFVHDELQHFVKRHDIDLIVMGTTGASGLQEIFIGSNAASVVSKSEVPVMVIPHLAKPSDFKHLLYASDYNEPEFPAVSRLIYFADLFHSKITVLHVKTEYDFYMNSERNFFKRNKDNISHHDITVVNMDKVETTDAINQLIDEKQVDLLVLAKHNRSWFDRLFHRSFSKRMAFHTKIPLLVLNK
jgi:nucleotide-binding universal stress UspA family protein